MSTQVYLKQTIIAALAFACGVVFTVDAGKRSPETDLAAPGAPLYEFALNESVKGLKSKQEQDKLEAQSRPPSPGPDYFWCKNCKTYHKKKNPALDKKPTKAQPSNTAPATPKKAHAASASKPPSPGPDYFWCGNCKVYHKKKVPAASATRPVSPGADSFWCENCKTYHKRQPTLQMQATTNHIHGVSTNRPSHNPSALNR